MKEKGGLKDHRPCAPEKPGGPATKVGPQGGEWRSHEQPLPGGCLVGSGDHCWSAGPAVRRKSWTQTEGQQVRLESAGRHGACPSPHL